MTQSPNVDFRLNRLRTQYISSQNLSGYLIEECVYFNLSRNVEMNLLSLKVDEINEAGEATQLSGH